MERHPLRRGGKRRGRTEKSKESDREANCEERRRDTSKQRKERGAAKEKNRFVRWVREVQKQRSHGRRKRGERAMKTEEGHPSWVG